MKADSIRRGLVLPTVLIAALAASALPAAAVAPTLPGPVLGDPGLGRALDAMPHLATDGGRREKARTKPHRGLPVHLGKDGRLTMMLIGSDWRPDAGGERTDVMIVMTVDPVTKVAAAASLPRDMTHIPFAKSNGGGSSGGLRINSLYYIRYRDPDLPHAGIDRRGLDRLSKDVGALLGTEIDHWAFLRFATFSSVINKLGGVELDIPQPVLDPYYHSGNSKGIYFPAKDGYRLKGDPDCNPYPRQCRSALVYARSRKGTVGNAGNNDYSRAERQQKLIMGGIKKVTDRYGSGLPLLLLLMGIRKHAESDIPATPEAAAQLFDILDGVRLPTSNMKVLAPGTWAYTDRTTPLYTFRPDLRTIRDWVDRAFYKVKPPRGERGGADSQGNP